MNYVLNAVITVIVVVSSIYIYDEKFVRNYTDYEILTISDSLGRERIQFGEFGSGDVKRYGFVVRDRYGKGRLFYGISDVDGENGYHEEPLIVMYNSEGESISTLMSHEEQGLVAFSIGPFMREGSVSISADNESTALTLRGVDSEEYTNEISLFVGESPSINLMGGRNLTVLHAKENEKSVVVVKDEKRIWTAPN